MVVTGVNSGAVLLLVMCFDILVIMCRLFVSVVMTNELRLSYPLAGKAVSFGEKGESTGRRRVCKNLDRQNQGRCRRCRSICSKVAAV